MINPFDILSGKLENIERLLLDIKYKEDTQAKKELEERLLSPEKTRKLFDPAVSLTTLNTWASEGILNKHHIGGRTYSKYSEIIESAKTVKKYKRTASHG